MGGTYSTMGDMRTKF